MITKEDVEYVAGLARLELTEEEKEEFAKPLAIYWNMCSGLRMWIPVLCRQPPTYCR